jgi:hypothetical protein
VAARPRAAGEQTADTRAPYRGCAFNSRRTNCRFCSAATRFGSIEGRNLTIEYCWAERRNERYAQIAGEFVRLAKALGLDGPPQLRARADQVIA